MPEQKQPFPSSTVLAIAPLVLSGLALAFVRPSAWTPGISELELHIAAATTPLLAGAAFFAVCGIASAWTGKHRYTGLWAVLSLLLINLAGILTTAYGADGIGLLGTVPLTAVPAIVAARRETAWRRSQPPSAAPSS